MWDLQIIEGKKNNKLVYNQDPNAHLIQLQKLIVVKVELNC